MRDIGEKFVMMDSGIGGLSVFNQMFEICQNVGISYVADNKFFPYGEKKDVDLINIIDRLLTYFILKDNSKVIIACNTASIIYNKYLKYRYKDQVSTIIDSTINELGYGDHKKIGVIATTNTIESKVYENFILNHYNVSVISLACQELVYLCEENLETKIEEYINRHFQVFKDAEIDTLILGCTHFNMIKDIISRYFNDQIQIICSGYRYMDLLCVKNDLLNKQPVIYLTQYDEAYIDKIKKLFPNLKNIDFKELNIS